METAVNLLRSKHKYGETYYWLLYYTYLSPQQYKNTEEIIEQLQPHIRDISYRTYFSQAEGSNRSSFVSPLGLYFPGQLKSFGAFFPENEKGM